MLERLHGENAPERLFTTVADIGPKLAQRIHEELGIETLSELSAAAHDGRLGRVRGMGGKRVQAVREALAGRFRQGASPHPAPARRETERGEPPPLEELLDIDREYRQLARQGKLPRIAPRRFNPTNDAWLPVLHTEREGRHYTALYSNTARAHELGTTHDWVVIYCDDDQRGGSWTAITASYGPLRGRRVIRGPRTTAPGIMHWMRSPPIGGWCRNGFHFDQRPRCCAAWPRLARLRRVSGRGHPPLPPKNRSADNLDQNITSRSQFLLSQEVLFSEVKPAATRIRQLALPCPMDYKSVMYAGFFRNFFSCHWVCRGTPS